MNILNQAYNKAQVGEKNLFYIMLNFLKKTSLSDLFNTAAKAPALKGNKETKKPLSSFQQHKINLMWTL